MIKSICKFISGDVIKTNQTNRTIYLSDNTKWNSSKFHEYTALIRAFMNRESQQSQYIKDIQDEIDRMNAKIESRVNSREYYYSRIKGVFNYGKYRGRKISDIAKIDVQYVNWYFDNVENQDINNY